jgi:hypothetical protein
MKLREIPGLFKEAAIEWFNDNVPHLGAALAYFIGKLHKDAATKKIRLKKELDEFCRTC